MLSSNSAEVVGYLEKMFHVLNYHYFDGDLPMPVITLWHDLPEAVVFREVRTGTCYEFRVGRLAFAHGLTGLVTDLMHVCAHLWCAMNGITDVDEDSVHHSAIFQDVLRSRDVVVEYRPDLGWGVSKGTVSLFEFAQEQGWEHVFFEMLDLLPALILNECCEYVCPMCDAVIWAEAPVHVRCMACDVPFVRHLT